MGLWDDEPTRRSLGIREKQILYDRAQHKCENCNRGIEFSDMQVGHKTAYSKGGGTTLRNSVALCYGCNKKQGTDSWEVFQRKQGKTVAVDNLKNILNKLSMKELKYIATKHGVKLKGRHVKGGLFEDGYYDVPSKQRYVKELAKVVKESDVKSALHDLLNSRLR
jgi:hypothetical protein